MIDEVVPLTTLDEARQSADSWTLESLEEEPEEGR
jgi:hypothetical protein